MKKLNFLLYKNLIESDFLLVDNKFSKNSNLQNKIIKNQNFLDIFVIYKELNQFLYLIKYIKKKKGLIHILDDNLEYNFFIFEKIYSKEIMIKLKETLLTKKTFNKSISKNFIKKSKLLLNFNSERYSVNILRSYFRYSFFLVQFINLYRIIDNCGFYKIFNDIENYKNIIFLTLLLKKI